MSSGTIINDGLSPVLTDADLRNIPYTAFLDLLVSRGFSINDSGTLNIILKPGRALKTGPWRGGKFVGDASKYFPGVSGLPSSIVNGDSSSPSDNEKNAYSHLQIGKSALGSSLWFLLQNNTVSIDAYKNLNQILEPANPTALGLNLYRKTDSSAAGNVYLGTGFYGPLTYFDHHHPPIMVVHNSRTSAQVGFGGLSTPNLTGSGAHVKGDLNITGQIFGKIGAVRAFNRFNLGKVMDGESTTLATDYESPGSGNLDPAMYPNSIVEVTDKGHALTLPLRLNPEKFLTKVAQPGFIKENGALTDYDPTNWPYTKNLGWEKDDYDFQNTTSAELNGFVLVEAVCNLAKEGRDLLHMRTVVENVSKESFTFSPWTVFEFGEQSDVQTFVNLTEFTAGVGNEYRFYVQFLKWHVRNGGDNPDHDQDKYYSRYPLTVTSTKCIMYVLPASLDVKNNDQ